MNTTQRRRWWLACVLTGSLLAFGGWQWLTPPPQPKWEGKPLNYWFKEYCRSAQTGWDRVRQEESIAALRQMGTNALPHLLQQAFSLERNPALNGRVVQFLNGLPRLLHLPLFLTPEDRVNGATRALQAIQPPATLLLPTVMPHLTSSNTLEHRQALIILGTAGDRAEMVVPHLVKALTEPDHWSRVCALQSLRWIGPKADAAVPALIESLRTVKGTNAMEFSTALTLGSIGRAAAPGLPLVQGLWEKETNWSHRCTLAGTLCRIDSNQTNAWTFLTNGLTNPQFRTGRWEIVTQLGEIGPSARFIAPLLLEAMDETDTLLMSHIYTAFKKMGVAPETFLPRFKAQLQQANPMIRANIASLVLDSEPSDRAARIVLMDLIRTNALLREYAIETLGRTGPAAREAIPLLRGVAATGPESARESAHQALKRITAPDQTSASPPSQRQQFSF